jgi:hypothetical protein
LPARRRTVGLKEVLLEAQVQPQMAGEEVA